MPRGGVKRESVGSDCDNHLSQRCLLARSNESWRSFSLESKSFMVDRSEGFERAGIGGVATLNDSVSGVGSRI